MESERTRERIDVLIGGGGFAGLALAIALRQGLGPSFSVTVADPALARAAADGRASAIVAAARRLFETIGVWDQVEAQPILDMVVTDSRLHDAVRPTFLTFEGDLEPGEPFAHMVENGPLLAALTEKAKAGRRRAAVVSGGGPSRPRTRRKAPAKRSARGSSHVTEVELADGSALSARLLVAADGAHSAIRERAGIASHGWNYGQSAIVTTVAHERDHNGRAEEHFLPAGPFAILPLKTTRPAATAPRSSGPRRRRRPRASSRCPTPSFTPSSSGASACISARSKRSARAASFRSAFGSRAHSSPIASRWSAMPPMSFIRSRGRGSIWVSRTSPRSPK